MKKSGFSFYYGYIILATAWLLYFCTFGTIIYGSAVINASMQSSLGFGEEYIGTANTICMLLSGLMGPVAGRLISKKGVRISFIIGSLFICAASAAMVTLVESQTGFLICYGLLIGIGIGFAGLVAVQTLVNDWFDRKKSTALALVFTAGSVGGFTAPQIVEKLMSAGDWRWGWYYVFAMSALALLLSLFLLKNRPEDVGQHLDGLDSPPVSELPALAASEAEAEVPKGYFWRILFNYVTRNALYYSFVAYTVVFMRAKGYDSGLGAAVLSIVSVSSLCGRLILGFIPEKRAPAQISLATGNIIMGIGSALVTLGTARSVIFIGGAAFGLGVGFVTVALPLVVSRLYGQKRFAVVNGRLCLLNYLFSAAGPSAVGAAAGVLNGYWIPFLVVSLLAVFGGSAVLTIKRVSSRSPSGAR